VRVRIDRVLAAAFESGDFEPLVELYAADALLDWSMPGRRVRVVGPGAIGKQLRAWWPGSGVFTRWDVWTFPSGLTVEFERRAGGALQRQRQFLQVREGRIVRHQAYCARPHGSDSEGLPDDAPVVAARRLNEIARREPLTHAGQSGTSLERIVLADGRRLVVKRLSGDDWVARVTHDGGREASLWTDGVLARMPREIDHAVIAAGREGSGTWLLMRDVSDELLPPDRRLTREESRHLLATFAAMHRRFAGERIDGTCSLEDRIRIAAPATVAGEVDGVDYLPKILAVGWEVFAEAVPEDVATAVLGAVEDPEPLARELARCPPTLIHNDLRGANLGLLSDRTIVLDWGMAGTGPCELDFAWYLSSTAGGSTRRASSWSTTSATLKPICTTRARSSWRGSRSSAARPPARARARRGERRETRAGAGGTRAVGGACARGARAAVTDAFKELEVAGWREPGRGDAYDAVVGRVTARVAEPLLDAVGVRAGASLLDVGTGTATSPVPRPRAARTRSGSTSPRRCSPARAACTRGLISIAPMRRASRSRTAPSTRWSRPSCSTMCRARSAWSRSSRASRGALP